MSDLKEKMTEMSGLFSNKKLNVVDESGCFVRLLSLALSLAFAAENIRTFKSTARASCS